MGNETTISFQLPPMPYYIATGLTEYTPGEQHPNRRNLGLFDLLWVTKGTLYMGEDEKEWTVTAGETLLLLPDRYHYSTKPCDSETAFYWIHFDFKGEWTEQEAGASSLPLTLRHAWDNPYLIQLPQYAAPPEFTLAERHLSQLLLYSNEQQRGVYWQEHQLFIELLGLLEDRRDRSNNDTPALRLASRTEAYIRQHYQTELTNSALAEALHFHPNYIVRCMKEIYHCSPMEYLHQYRMEQAKLLLVKTEWSISVIADKTGFRHAPYFSNCFKAYTGTSPLKYRKQFAP
ncbi:helix-turn-helix domain-containing protein [Paenibacillus glycanilyticus]|uniref:HTH-type transcriptional regulator YisR n=1 Tax=Paenibacillus glycanilyticus TaxID=126569 RepID=A0ABQ6GDA2_9BACL|nr:AraC family transcriptional regulator [Paenibacillus glycanilyticus]GLX68929.1 putative HTH-type transcriptional regulator YisR [Paenibacillus glycanilyticus]